LRFQAFSEEHDYVLVLSLQADGQINVYAPFHGTASAPIRRGQITTLGHESIVLDQSNTDELLIALFSGHPINAPEAMAEVKKAFLTAGRNLQEMKMPPLPDSTVITHLLRGSR